MEDQNNQVDVNAAVDAALKEQKKKSKKKKLIIFGVIALVLIIIIAVSSGGNDAEPTDPDPNASTSQKADEDKTVYEAGEAVQLSDVKITYVDCDANCTNYDEYSKPESGMKYVRASFIFENTSDYDVSLNSLDCYADDTSYDAEYFAFNDFKSPTLESISPGKKFNATVYYEVPADAKDIILQYETSFFSSKCIEFVIK